jgi:hypothetical protein
MQMELVAAGRFLLRGFAPSLAREQTGARRHRFADIRLTLKWGGHLPGRWPRLD